jgi:hypothetical protein
VIDRQVEKLKQERNRWTSILQEHTVTDAQFQELEEIAASIGSGLQAVSTERKSYILDRLRVKLTAAREDGISVLYISILGYKPARVQVNGDSAAEYGRIAFAASTSNHVACHNVATVRL